MEKVYILRWYGPFQPEQLREWEISQKATFNLYLISGKRKFIIILVKQKENFCRID